MVATRLPQIAHLRDLQLLCASCALWLACAPLTFAQQEELNFFEESDAAFADLHVGTEGEPCEVCSPDAANFGQWDSLVEERPADMHVSHPDLFPLDWFRHVGFRHSSSHSRHVGKGIPLKGPSWLNRPFHYDTFVGPFLGDDLIKNRVSQNNVLLGGVRLGWDFDYYWGIEWRYGQANARTDFASDDTGLNDDLDIVLSDVDLIYYPWGDSKVRPYFLLGCGFTRFQFIDDQNVSYNSHLVTMPFGGGVRFMQYNWLIWRLEVLDNLAFGADNLDTMNNVSLTASMELRFGAKPATYWPWRTGRKVW